MYSGSSSQSWSKKICCLELPWKKENSSSSSSDTESIEDRSPPHWESSEPEEEDWKPFPEPYPLEDREENYAAWRQAFDQAPHTASYVKLPMINYGYPNPNWTTWFVDPNAYQTALHTFLHFADGSNQDREYKFTARCNTKLACDLTAGDRATIQRAVDWIQRDFVWPKYSEKPRRLLGEDRIWEIVYEISERRNWHKETVMKLLSYYLHPSMVPGILSSEKRIHDRGLMSFYNEVLKNRGSNMF